MGNQDPAKPSLEPPQRPRQPGVTLEGMTAAFQEVTDAYNDSERRYRELVESSLGLICTHDLSGTILSINPAAANSLGYRPEDGIGRNLREFLSPDKRALFDSYLQRIQQYGQDAGLMSVVSRAGGTRVWMYRNVLSRGHGGASCVLGHAIDVTERIIAERTLRQSEQALRAAHAELESRVKERTRDLEEANARLRVEIAEREDAERSRERALVEQRDTLAFLANFSDRLASLVTFEQLVDISCRLPVPFLADWAIVHTLDDDGAVRWSPASCAGARPEAILREMAPSSGRDDRSDLDRVIATGHLSILNLRERPGAPAVYPAVPAGPLMGAGVETVAMVPMAVSGRVKAVLSLLSKDADRFAAPRSLVVEDVGRRISLALDRIQLYREAQEANRLKDEFLSTLSHELRTPLNAIFGWARILKSRQLDAHTSHAIDVIQRNAEAQIRLIEEVLDVSRIVAGKMTIASEVVDLHAIMRATIDAVRPALQAKRITLQERLEDVPRVTGDSHRLQQVFWNLFSNAIKFTGTEGTISIALRRSPRGIELEITDTGVGIRRDVLPFVFDRFRQADSSTTRTYGGLGLGLAIVKHIIELHGGSIAAASAGEGRGATFTILLPVAHRATMGGPGEAVAPAAAASQAASTLRGRTVLVVEDHDDARELISAVLAGAGARVIPAATTREAMKQIAKDRPDVLVADLGLPEEDGFALLEQFRARYPEVPAIALTAYARATDRDRALAAGFQHHLVKPMEPKDLVDVIASMLT